MPLGTRFRLVGNTRAFHVVSSGLHLGRIPVVVGVSTCGRYRTYARIADVLRLR